MRYQLRRAIIVTAITISCTVAIAVSIQEVRKKDECARQAMETKIKADRGDQASEVALGKMYYYGNGLPQSYSEAFHWSLKAAERGNAQAEYDLGILYELGRGVPQDFSTAFHWYQKAAIQGHAWAQESVGTLYYQGRGVGKNPVEAFGWYQKAAENGLARAQYLLGYMYQCGLGVQQDNVQAQIWYAKASAQGDASAQRSLGLRGSGLAGGEVLSLVAIALAWTWLGRHFWSSKQTMQGLRMAVTVVCGLAYVAMRVFGAYAGFRSLRAFDIFQLIENGAAGMAMGMFVYFSRSIEKFVRVIWGVIMAGLVAVSLFMLRDGLWALNIHDQKIYLTLCGLLVGIAIPVSAFCMSHLTGGKTFSP